MAVQESPHFNVPAEISRFFATVCECSPEATVSDPEDKTYNYSIPGQVVTEGDWLINTDSYQGCHLEVKQIPADKMLRVPRAIEDLAAGITRSLSDLKRVEEETTFNFLMVDFDMPVTLKEISSVLPDSFKIGDPESGNLIKDEINKKLHFWKWLNPDKPCTVPFGATYSAGGLALIIDQVAQKVLLVESKGRKGAWNIPGGSPDPIRDRSPRDTAIREAQEEGGFKIEGGNSTACISGSNGIPSQSCSSSSFTNLGIFY
jgi:hypothetical protein